MKHEKKEVFCMFQVQNLHNAYLSIEVNPVRIPTCTEH